MKKKKSAILFLMVSIVYFNIQTSFPSIQSCYCHIAPEYLHYKDILGDETDQDPLADNKPLLVSLGDRCITAWQIKIHGYRFSAFPFDWNITSINGLLEILIDNFKFFLNTDHLMRHPDIIFRHCLWNKYYDILLAHDFPNDPTSLVLLDNWQDFLSEVSNKYIRRIKKFNTIAEIKNKVFFIRSFYPDHPLTKSQALVLKDLLHKKFRNVDLELIVIAIVGAHGKQKINYNHWNIPGIKYFTVEDHGWFAPETVDQFSQVFKALGIPKNPS